VGVFLQLNNSSGHWSRKVERVLCLAPTKKFGGAVTLMGGCGMGRFALGSCGVVCGSNEVKAFGALSAVPLLHLHLHLHLELHLRAVACLPRLGLVRPASLLASNLHFCISYSGSNS
jgi:hypothetical protein